MDLARSSFGGEALHGAVLRDKILLRQPNIKTFLSGFLGKTAEMARRRRFFLENSQFQAIFKQFLVFPRR